MSVHTQRGIAHNRRAAHRPSGDPFSCRGSSAKSSAVSRASPPSSSVGDGGVRFEEACAPAEPELLEDGLDMGHGGLSCVHV